MPVRELISKHMHDVDLDSGPQYADRLPPGMNPAPYSLPVTAAYTVALTYLATETDTN